jgi:hypothetical protein
MKQTVKDLTLHSHKSVRNDKSEENWTEARLQAECFQWHWNTFINERGLLFTVDNNAADAVKGNIRKAMGRIPGVSDMIYVSAGKVTFIELKLPNGTQSSVQKDWERLVSLYGHRYKVVRSLEEFQRLIHWIREQASV